MVQGYYYCAARPEFSRFRILAIDGLEHVRPPVGQFIEVHLISA